MFSLEDLRRDVPASVVVFFVALPLCLGIALASGAPLFSGLIAGIVGGLVVGSISGAQLGVSGPAAGLAVIVLGAIETLGSFESFLIAVVLAGLIQVGFGILRGGVIGYFFPSSVIRGMLTGIGFIIILKQIPHAIGYDASPEGSLAYAEPGGATTFSVLHEMLGYIHPGAVLITVGALAILIAWELASVKQNRVLGLLPGPVVAVLFAIGCQLFMAGSPSLSLSGEQLVSVPVASSIGEVAGLFTIPSFAGQLGNPDIWAVAFTIAIVASIETLLSVEAIDKMDPHKRMTPTNRELIAQGIGNSVSGLIGGLPITQVIVRSSVNLQMGARSKASAVMHGGLLLVSIVMLPGLLNMIPLAVLAAVLLVTGYKLAKPELFVAMWRDGLEQFIPFMVTIVGVVFTDLLMGVGMGMAVAVFMLLLRNYRNSHFLHLHAAHDGEGQKIVTMLLAEEVTFLNKAAIKRELDGVPDGCKLVIDETNCVHMNHDVAELISEFIAVAPERDISVRVIERSEGKAQVAAALEWSKAAAFDSRRATANA